jgi:hypothetical protein
MVTKFPDSDFKRSPSAPKARASKSRKPAPLRHFPDEKGVQRCTPHYTPQPGAILREPGPSGRELEPDFPDTALGVPLLINEVARIIGCSPWTVRQTLIPRGLPHLRFTANGRLIFYRDQVIRWIENQQQGGK